MIGVISAMQEEMQTLLSQIKNTKEVKKGMRTYYFGELFNQNIVLVFSRWGKVASATTATQLINDFPIDEIIFTGVAGSINENINIGDIVIGKNLYQHDMDASPLFPPYEIPLLNKIHFNTDTDKRDLISKATQIFLSEIDNYINKKESRIFYTSKPKIYIEDIASGDQFISNKKQIQSIKNSLPSVVCVEMEGASIAQVCYEYNIPFSIIRTISDKANDNSHIDFQKFSKEIASKYAFGILQKYFELKSI